MHNPTWTKSFHFKSHCCHFAIYCYLFVFLNAIAASSFSSQSLIRLRKNAQNVSITSQHFLLSINFLRYLTTKSVNHEAPVPSHTGNYYHVCISAKLDMRYLFRGKLDILRRIRFQFRYLLEDPRYCFGRCLDIVTLEAGFPPTLGLVPLATLPALGERIVATALACDNIYIFFS